MGDAQLQDYTLRHTGAGLVRAGIPGINSTLLQRRPSNAGIALMRADWPVATAVV
jgi:hypothetical protein